MSRTMRQFSVTCQSCSETFICYEQFLLRNHLCQPKKDLFEKTNSQVQTLSKERGKA